MAAKSIPLTDLIGRTDAASLLGFNPRSLDRWAATGRGPRRFRIGNRAVYSRADIEQWLALRRIETGRGGQP